MEKSFFFIYIWREVGCRPYTGNEKLGAPIGAPGLDLAAAAVVIATATIIVVGVAAQAVIATAAEQDQQNDDPAPVTTAETIVIHNEYLQVFFAAKPLIPRYSMVRILCNGDVF